MVITIKMVDGKVVEHTDAIAWYDAPDVLLITLPTEIKPYPLDQIDEYTIHVKVRHDKEE